MAALTAMRALAPTTTAAADHFHRRMESPPIRCASRPSCAWLAIADRVRRLRHLAAAVAADQRCLPCEARPHQPATPRVHLYFNPDWLHVLKVFSSTQSIRTKLVSAA
ncbi:hypothetical protein ACP70R_033322 [Stipagrostis hirtigluma subsp. patula]